MHPEEAPIDDVAGSLDHRGPPPADVRRALARALGRCAAASPNDPSGRADAARAVAGLSPAVWRAVPAWAEGAGIGPAAHSALGALAPAGVAGDLADLMARTLARGRRLAADRAAIAVSFARARVPYRPLKGAWSSAWWSPPEARPMADTDLYVAPEMFDMAAAALHELGYAATARTWKHHVFVLPGNRAVVDRRGEHPDNPRPVELHPTMGEALRGVAWLGPDPRVPAGTVAGEAATLAHALAHASVDILEGRLRLVTLVDIACLRDALDEAVWARALALMTAAPTARLAWPVLSLAERELGVALPPGAEALAAFVRPSLRRWLDARDVDSVSRDGPGEAPRGLLDVAAVWPLDGRERRAMWRHAILPGRWQLADRYPALAASRAWPLVYARHAAFTTRLAVARIRNRLATGRLRARARRAGR